MTVDIEIVSFNNVDALEVPLARQLQYAILMVPFSATALFPLLLLYILSILGLVFEST